MKVTLATNYPPLAKGKEYTVISEGRDFYAVRHNGKRICVPKSMIGNDAAFEVDDDGEIILSDKLTRRQTWERKRSK